VSARVLQIRPLTLPRLDFMADPANTMRSADGRALLSFDPSTQCGLIYQIAQQRWTVMQPVAFEDFAVVAAAAGFQLGANDAARAWIARCMEGQRPAGARVQ